MPFANWLDDLLKHFIHYVAHATFKHFQFLR